MQLDTVGQIALEGVLDADRDALRLQLEPARVDAARPVAQDPPDAAGQETPQLGVGKLGQRPDRRHLRGDETLLGLRPDAGEPPDVEGGEKARLASGRHDGEPGRLAVVAGDLRDDLRRRHTQ